MKSYSGILPPVAAALVTGVLTGLMGAIPVGPEVTNARFATLMVLLMPVPLVVSVVWGMAFLAATPRRLAVMVGAAWLLAGLALQPADLVWPMAGYALGGLAAGWALASRMRLDWALGLVAAALLPILLWSLLQMPFEAQVQDGLDQAMEARREMLAGTADERQIELTLAEESRKAERIAEAVLKTLPASAAVGLLGISGIILALVYWISRRLRVAPAFRPLPPFTRWQLPFYLVWVLAGGLALVLTRQPVLVSVGLNTALVTALIISVQGIAVQGFVTNSLMSGPVQIVFWLVVLVFMAPLLFMSGVLLGLADYWLDIRRLNVPDVPEQDEDGGIHDDDPGA